jgi:hypothetical protein
VTRHWSRSIAPTPRAAPAPLHDLRSFPCTQARSETRSGTTVRVPRFRGNAPAVIGVAPGPGFRLRRAVAAGRVQAPVLATDARPQGLPWVRRAAQENADNPASDCRTCSPDFERSGAFFLGRTRYSLRENVTLAGAPGNAVTGPLPRSQDRSAGRCSLRSPTRCARGCSASLHDAIFALKRSVAAAPATPPARGI